MGIDTLWWTNIAMENHHCSWENPLFLWWFSIAMWLFTRGYYESFSSTSPTDPNWSQFSPCFSGWVLKKYWHLLWRIFVSSMTLHLRWLLHHLMILQLPNIYCSVFFWKATTSSNKNSLSSLGQLTMALFLFKRRIKTSKHMAPSGIYFPFRGMNIHLPAILMFTRGTRFWHTAICLQSFSHLFPASPGVTTQNHHTAGVASLIREDSAATALSEVAGNFPLNQWIWLIFARHF